jgi:peptide/nickel transport system permease protein
MEQLTWTGDLGNILNPVFFTLIMVFAVAVLGQFVASFAFAAGRETADAGGVLKRETGPQEYAGMAVRYSFLGIVAVILLYMLAGLVTSRETSGIIGDISDQLLPVWVSLVILFVVSINYKRRLGLYGKLFDNPVGMIGFGLVMFWVFAAVFADQVITHDALSQVSGMKNKFPGTPVRGMEGSYYLLGGDNLARDVFSRLIVGGQEVLKIAPAATVFAFMVGITLGLPAGYYGGRLDTILSFAANLVLAFPVILLFYLLVTPEIRETGVITWLAGVLFIFPVIFLWVLLYSRWRISPRVLTRVALPIVVFLLMVYFGTVFEMDPFVGLWTGVMGYLNQGNPIGEWMTATADGHSPLLYLPLDANKLNIFVAVVFVNSPTIYRIVRGLTMDIQTRDYVAAAQTRGEGPWYIMLWEILPNARGPLIVDFCLRVGYTTILLGTLGFFGLGLSPESPDWGSTINEGRKLLSVYVHPALPPALALMSMVLGLNLLADGLREESLKD